MLDEREKRLVYIAITIILILMIIILIIIWSPMFTNKEKNLEITSVHSYEDGYYVDKKKEEYKNVVRECINKDNFDNTYEILDADYVISTDLDKENLKESLISQKILTYTSSSTVIYCSSVRNDGKRYIYTYIYKIGDIERKVHIIEDYINNYTVSFDQDAYPVVDNKVYDIKDKTTGLQFKIKELKCYEESILMEITIVNNTTEEFKFNNTDVNDSTLLYSEKAINKISYLSSIVVGATNSEILSIPGSTNKINLSYGINISKQDYINMITFNNVERSNGEKINIELALI